MQHFFILILLIITILTGCSHDYDPRLLEINDLADRAPKQALSRLDSIDAGSLSTADRHFYDFLTIKAADKNYQKHTSDSLVLDVIDYMTDNADNSLFCRSSLLWRPCLQRHGRLSSRRSIFSKSP